MTEEIVQLACTEDITALVALINEAYSLSESEIWLEGPNFRRTDTTDLENIVNANLIYVARNAAKGGEIMGCVSFESKNNYLAEFGYLCVKPQYKRQGLATKLVEYCQDLAKARGHNTLQCELLVPRDLAEHPHAFKEMMMLKFYPSMGFHASRRVNFESAYPRVVAHNKLRFDCDALIFQKALPRTKPASGDDVIIVGGGIHGAAIAYYLAQRPGADRPRSITVVEHHSIAAAASGKAGGFLAKDWGSGDTVQLHEMGFELHCELARIFKLEGFRRGLEVLSVDGNSRDRSSIPTKWLDGHCTASPLSSNAAQVTPSELTHKFIEHSGAHVIIDIAEGVEVKSGSFQGIRTRNGGTLPGSKLVIAAGPWSGTLVSDWFGLPCPIEGVKSTSFAFHEVETLKDDTQAFAVFSEEHEKYHTHLELYPRPNGDLYVCGCGGSDHIFGDRLREGGDSFSPEDIHADPIRLQAAEEALHSMTSIVRGRNPSVTQACMRPCSEDGLPIMGEVSHDVAGVFISTAHNCWGILWAPICGKAMAELVSAGTQSVLNLRPFSLDRFQKRSHLQKRGRKKAGKDVGEQW